MADTDILRVGKAYRVCTDAAANQWARYSYWTLASDVELNDGQNIQDVIDKLQIDSDGIVLNAVNAQQALNSTFSELADEAVSAVTATDVTFVGDAILDKIVEIQGSELITETIRAPSSEDEDTSGGDDIVEPYEVSRKTVEIVDTDIKLGDNMAEVIGKIKKQLADLNAKIDEGGGTTPTPTPTPTPGGTNNYNDLINKPTINGVPLQGNLLLSALMDESSAVPKADITIMVEEAFADD